MKDLCVQYSNNNVVNLIRREQHQKTSPLYFFGGGETGKEKQKQVEEKRIPMEGGTKMYNGGCIELLPRISSKGIRREVHRRH